MDGMETLREVVSDEARLCADLARVLRAEQQALIALRADAVVACLAERQALGAALEALAERRRGLVRALLAGRAAGDSLGSLLATLDAAEQAALRPALGALRRALLEARGLERQNARLARASVETTHEILRALAALVPGARYGADARLTPAAAERVARRA